MGPDGSIPVSCKDDTKLNTLRVTDTNGCTKRYEVKTSRFSYDNTRKLWKIDFVSVNKKNFDHLVLCVEGLDGIRLYLWKGAGLTQGHIGVCASRSQPNEHAGQLQVLAKMGEINAQIKFVGYSDPEYSDLWSMTSEAETQYAGVPLGDISPKARGDAIEWVVRAIARNVVGKDVDSADITPGKNGKLRARNRTACDFKEDDTKVEVKSSIIRMYGGVFSAQFSEIKQLEHDILYFALMSPSGIHVFRHDRSRNIMRKGQKRFELSSPGGKSAVTDMNVAEEYMLKNLQWLGLPRIAFVEFSKGDMDTVEQRASVW
eukprot:1632634-Prymnesium_polylepis.1